MKNRYVCGTLIAVIFAAVTLGLMAGVIASDDSSAEFIVNGCTYEIISGTETVNMVDVNESIVSTLEFGGTVSDGYSYYTVVGMEGVTINNISVITAQSQAEHITNFTAYCSFTLVLYTNVTVNGFTCDNKVDVKLNSIGAINTTGLSNWCLGQSACVSTITVNCADDISSICAYSGPELKKIVIANSSTTGGTLYNNADLSTPVTGSQRYGNTYTYYYYLDKWVDGTPNLLVTAELAEGHVSSTPSGWKYIDSDTYTKLFPYETSWSTINSDFGSPSKTGYTFSSWSPSAGTLTAASTMTASYTAKTFNIILDKNGGSTSGSATATYGCSSLTNLTHATRDGYDLAGYTSSSNELIINADGTLVPLTAYTGAGGIWTHDGNVTLYAKWGSEKHTVTFKSQDGTDTLDTVQVDNGGTAVYTKSEPTKSSTSQYTYTFVGWNTQTGQTSAESGVLTNITADKTVYAAFSETLRSYTVTLVSSPTVSSTFTYKIGTGAPVSYSAPFSVEYGKTLSVTVSVSTGYSFSKWDDDSTSVTRTGTVNGTTTWTATSTPITYTIAFSGNGSTGGTAVSSISAIYDQPYAAPSNTWTKIGHTFTKWNTEEDGSGTDYTVGSTLKNLRTTAGTVTLYAQWTAKTYTVILKPNGGLADGSATATYGSNVLTDIEHVTRTGYNISGYTQTIAGVLIVNADGTLVSNTAFTDSSGRWNMDNGTTLYAKWTAKTYEITLDKGAGTVNGSATATYDSSSLSGKTAPTYTGHMAEGYYTDSSLGTKVANADGSLIANISGYTGTGGKWIRDSSAILYTKWNTNQYTVTLTASPSEKATFKYSIDDGTEQTYTAPFIIAHSAKLTITAIPDSLYVFEKWSDNDTNATRTFDNVAADITLTATNVQTFVVSGIEYTIISADNVEVSDLISVPYYGNVSIPSSVTYSGRTFSVTEIGNRAFEGSLSLKSVIIPNSVTVIGEYAFLYCSNLKSITVPESVVSIEEYAFFGTAITTMTLPSNLTVLNEGVFYSCTSLTAIEIPDKVTSIGKNAFGTCYTLTSITIPAGVTSVGDYAFHQCTSLTSVTIPDTVTSISTKQAFGLGISDDNVTCYVYGCQSGKLDDSGNSYTTFIYEGGYNVTYMLDGEQYGDVDTVYYGTEVTVREKATKAGYSSATDWSSTDVTISGGKFTMPAKDITIVASSADPISYTIAFSGNGSTGGTAISSISATYGQSYTAPSNTWTKSYSTFSCWNTAEDGSGTDYVVGADLKNLTATSGATVTLYAKWTDNTRTITITNDISKTYDGSAVGDVAYIVSAGSGTVTVEYKKGTGTYSTTKPIDAGSYTVKVTVADDGVYHEAYAEKAFTIANANITGTISQNGTLTYNASSQIAAVSNNLVSVNSQTITVTYCSTADGTYTSSVPGFTSAGSHTVYYKANAPNHNENTGTFTVTIGVRDITGATINLNDSPVYNGSEQTQTIASVISDPVSIPASDYTVTGNKSTHVGDVTLTVTGTGNCTGTVSVTWSIQQATQDISYAVTEIGKSVGETFTNTLTQTLVYGTISYTSSVPAVATVNSSTGSVTTVTNGTTVITATVSGNADYASDTAEYTLNVGTNVPAASDFDYSSPANLDYTGTVKSASVTVKSGITGMGTVTVRYYSDSAYTEEVSASNVKNAGTYYVAVDVSAGASYVSASKIYGSDWNFTIAKVALTVKANDKTITYGDDAANDGVTYTGFVNGEDKSVLGGSLSYAYTYDKTVASKRGAGSYDITPSGLTSDNYQITFTKGTLTVSQKQAILVWSCTADMKYDGNAKIVTVSVSNKAYAEDTFDITAGLSPDNNNVDAGKFTYTATALGNDNYSLPSISMSSEYEITKRNVTLTSGSSSKVYDGSALTNDSVAVSGDGFVGTQGVTCIVTGTQTVKGFSDNEFTYMLKDNTKSENYNISTSFGTLTVTAITTKITITAHSDSKKYDGTALTDLGYTYTDGILVSGDELTAVTSGSITDVGTTSNTISSYKVMRGDTNVTDCYSFNVPVSGVLTVVKRGVILTSASDSKPYDGTPLTKHVVNVSGDGFATGEGASYDFTGSQTVKGTSKNTFSYTLNLGTKASNYGISTIEGDLTVTNATFTVNDISDVTYSGLQQKQSPVVKDSVSSAVLVLNTDYNVSYSSELTNVCTVTVTVTGIGNYDGDVKQVTYDINPAPLKITANNSSITYGDDPIDNGVAYAGFVNDEDESVLTGTLGYVFTYDKSNPDTRCVGAYGITPSGLSAQNYDIAFIDGTLTVGQKEADLSWTAPGNLVYTGTEKVPAVSVSNKVYTDDVFSIVKGLTSGKDNVNVGKFTFTVTALGNANYCLPDSTVSPEYEIVKAPLTVTAKPHSIIYGDEKANNGVTYSGFVNGEDESVLGGELSFTYTYDRTVASKRSVGEYDITPYGLTASNYSISFMAGILTVTQKEAALSWTAPANLTYDGNVKVPAAEVSNGAYPEDTFVIVASLNPGDNNVDAGTFTYAVSSVGNDNYSLPSDASVSYTIQKRDVTMTSADDSKVYDGTELTNSSVIVSGDGFVGEEGAVYIVMGSQTVKGFSDNVFVYTLKDNTKSDNYNISTSFGTLTVTAITTKITITADSDSKMYDGTALTAPGYTYTGGIVVSGDSLIAVTSGSITDVGSSANTVTSYKVMKGDVNVTDCYTFDDCASGTLTVTKRSVTLTSGSASKVYDGTPLTKNEVTVSGDGFVGEEGVVNDVTGSQTVKGSSDNVFTYTLKDNTKSDNYNISTSFGTLTVTAITTKITITADSDSKMYDGTALTAPGYTYTDGILISGDILTAVTSGSITDAGSVSNAIVSYKVIKGDVDVTYCYTFDDCASGTLTVTKRSVTLTSASASKVYDGTPLTKNDVTVSGDGFVGEEGVVNDVTGSQTVKGSSDNVFTYTFKSGTKGSNYDVLTASGTLTVTASSIYVDPMTDVTYNGSEQKQSPVVWGDNTGIIITLGTDYTVSYGGDLVNAGTVEVTVTGIGNYEGTVETAYVINQASLIVTAKPNTIVYGDAGAGNGVSYKGFVGGENESVLGGMLAYTFTYDIADPLKRIVGEYDIIPSGLTAANYDIAFVNGTLKVIAKEASLSWTAPADLAYDGTEKVPSAEVSNKVYSDDTFSIVKILTAGKDNVNAGKFTFTASELGNTNYVLSASSVSQEFEITKRSLIVTADELSKTFSDADPEFTYISGTAVAGETPAFSGKLSRDSGEDVGTYLMRVGTLALIDNGTFRASNYEIDMAERYFTIVQKTVAASDFTVDLTDETFSGTPKTKKIITALKENIDYKVAYTDNLNSGTAKIAITGIGNYCGSLDYQFNIRKLGLDAPKELYYVETGSVIYFDLDDNAFYTETSGRPHYGTEAGTYQFTLMPTESCYWKDASYTGDYNVYITLQKVVVKDEGGNTVGEVTGDKGIRKDIVVTIIGTDDVSSVKKVFESVDGTPRYKYTVKFQIDGNDIVPEGNVIVKLTVPRSASGHSFEVYSVTGDTASKLPVITEGNLAVISFEGAPEYVFVVHERAGGFTTVSFLMIELIIFILIIACYLIYSRNVQNKSK